MNRKQTHHTTGPAGDANPREVHIHHHTVVACPAVACPASAAGRLQNHCDEHV